MKELLFLLEDGVITGVTVWGYLASWLVASAVLYSLSLLVIAWRDGAVSEDETIGFAIGIPVLLLVGFFVIHYWRASLVIAAVSLLLGGLPYGAVRLGQYLHDR